jgi:hypothetical protein
MKIVAMRLSIFRSSQYFFYDGKGSTKFNKDDINKQLANQGNKDI